MASTGCILRTIRRLVLNIRSGTLPDPADLPALAADWAEILIHVTDAELESAVLEYLRGPSPWWPTPGQLIALTPPARLAATLGTPAEADTAFNDFRRRMDYVQHRPSDDAPLDPDDPARNDAMFDALDAIGLDTWRLTPAFEANPFAADNLRKRWVAAYIASRKAQAADPVAVRAMVDRAAQRLLA